MLKNLMLSILTLFSSTSFAAEDELRIVGDFWCPYTCEVGARPGYLVELLEAALKGRPVKVTYHVVNWARAIKDARAGVYDAIGGASLTEAPDFMYPKKHQILIHFEVIGLASDQWQFEGDFRGRKVGVINGYAYDTKTNALIAAKSPNFQVISGHRGLDSLVPMLNSGRVNNLIESWAVFTEALRQKGIDPAKYKSFGKSSDAAIPHFIAFSPKYPKRAEVIQWLEEGQKRLERTGELKKLKMKYGLL